MVIWDLKLKKILSFLGAFPVMNCLSLVNGNISTIIMVHIMVGKKKAQSVPKKFIDIKIYNL